jgi:heme oxygenase
VQTTDDYVALLTRLYTFHMAAEQRLFAPWLRGEWVGLGIDILAYDRAKLLRKDLQALDAEVPFPSLLLPEPTTFGQALGYLYVVEGSALGGRVLAPAIRDVVVDAPTSFYDSTGRDHPRPWREVVLALHQFEGNGGEPDEVVLGASVIFTAFGAHLASYLWTSAS